MHPEPQSDWTPASLIAALRNAEAKLRDDHRNPSHWQEMVDTYRSMARRHGIRIER